MLLEVERLAVAYGDAPAVWDATLCVAAGEIVSVIGPNGAGKSTLVNTIAGLQRSRGGSLRFDGADLGAVAPHLVCRQGIALVPEGRRLFTRMSVEENLDMGCYRREARRVRGATLERVYGLFPILRERRHQVAASLSGGQQQMVAIGRALMARPRLLLLDEPSVGIAHRLKVEIFDVIKRIQRNGTAILMAEQDAQSALRIADRVYVLEHGHIGREGTAAELGADDYIRQAYLGVD